MAAPLVASPGPPAGDYNRCQCVKIVQLAWSSVSIEAASCLGQDLAGTLVGGGRREGEREKIRAGTGCCDLCVYNEVGSLFSSF